VHIEQEGAGFRHHQAPVDRMMHVHAHACYSRASRVLIEEAERCCDKQTLHCECTACCAAHLCTRYSSPSVQSLTL
jgi:hypothetical protein